MRFPLPDVRPEPDSTSAEAKDAAGSRKVTSLCLENPAANDYRAGLSVVPLNKDSPRLASAIVGNETDVPVPDKFRQL